MWDPDSMVFEDEMTEYFEWWIEQNKPKIYEVSAESRAIVKEVDPKFVWTSHTTCTENYLAPGFLEFSPSSCCWREQAWYVCEEPWVSDESKHWIPMSATLPCIECNKDMTREEGEGKEDCPTCEGHATYRFFLD